MSAGHLVFETRDPAAEAWHSWTREHSYRSAALDVGTVENWFEVTNVSLPCVSFRGTFLFSADGDVQISDSTLRFRAAAEVRGSLLDAGFGEPELRDAPDRTGMELVFIAPSGATRRGRRAARNR